jgi:hypothetical protein
MLILSVLIPSVLIPSLISMLFFLFNNNKILYLTLSIVSFHSEFSYKTLTCIYSLI